MDPLIIHHVIRHRLSRIETNNFQDKSGCSINGFRSFLFEEGIVRNLDDMEVLIHKCVIQDYRGYPIELEIDYFNNFPLSDEILRMKNVRFFFQDQSKPIHKLVSPEPYFIEEERNLIENHFFYMGSSYKNHFSYLGSSYKADSIEDWDNFQMDNEGHLVSMKAFRSKFQLSNESIEHLSNFPHLRTLRFNSFNVSENVTNFGLLSKLSKLSLIFHKEVEEDLFKDLGLFSNLISLRLFNYRPGN